MVRDLLLLGRPKPGWKNDIKWILKKYVAECVVWIFGRIGLRCNAIS
jgi:hypothetical protein